MALLVDIYIYDVTSINACPILGLVWKLNSGL